jgi:hypothetical protein
VHFAGPNPEIDVLESAYAREALAYPAYFQNRPIITWSNLCTGRHFLW